MTVTKPQPAGWIVFHKWNSDTIDGVGATQVEAWKDFLSTMDLAGVHVLDQSHETDKYGRPLRQPYVMVDNYTVTPASQALMDQIEQHGGNIAWARVGDVRCTIDEMQAYLVATEEEEPDCGRSDE